MEYSKLEQRKLDALENVAAELERLRLLFERVHGVRVVQGESGDPIVVEVGRD